MYLPMEMGFKDLDFSNGTWVGRGTVAMSHGPDGSVNVHFSVGDSKDEMGNITVWFDESGTAEQVKLHLIGGFRPSDLGRFPWARWIAVAWAAKQNVERGLDQDSAVDLIKKLNAARERQRTPRTTLNSKRGRPSLSEDFLRTVVSDYYDAISNGFRAPIQVIADKNHVSVTTARSWVSKARSRGLMPAGRRGRAG